MSREFSNDQNARKGHVRLRSVAFEERGDVMILEEKPELPTSVPADAVEYAVPLRTKLVYLTLYFTLSLGLAVYNKFVLIEFKFPFLLTAWHCLCALAGCSAFFFSGRLSLAPLERREHFVLLAFSTLYTANIAASTTSLSLVSLPFHELLRATGPAVTVILYRTLLSRSFSISTYLSLIPIIGGVAVATHKGYHFTALSFSVGVLGVLLAALKGIASNRMMTGSLKLPPFELLFRMAPLAAIQSLICSVLSGEMSRAIDFARTSDRFSGFLILALFFNGALAFALNVASLSTNKLAGALTIAVGGNVKQVLTIITGTIIWHIQISGLNAIGMSITVVGAFLYTRAELSAKR